MKKIQVLAILIVVILVFSGLKGGINGVIDGWNEKQDGLNPNLATVSVAVKVDKVLATDSLFNSAAKRYIPYHIETLKTKVEGSFWCVLVKFITGVVGLVFLYGIYCLIKMIVAVTRREVFIRENVFRMRVFIYMIILMGVLFELERYCQYCEIVTQIHLAGYEVESFSFKYPWLSFLIIALFTEIFAIGVKIKEEQDLTI